MGSFQSGQMGLTVTQLSFDFGGSNPSLPTKYGSMVEWSQYHPVTVRGAGSNPVRTALLLFVISSLIYEGKKNGLVRRLEYRNCSNRYIITDNKNIMVAAHNGWCTGLSLRLRKKISGFDSRCYRKKMEVPIVRG